MIVHARAGSATLSDVRNLEALSLQIEGDPATAVGSWGSRIDHDHVIVAIDVLVELAGPIANEPGWRADFDAMIAYAAGMGWVDESGGVRMHIDPRPTS